MQHMSLNKFPPFLVLLVRAELIQIKVLMLILFILLTE